MATTFDTEAEAQAVAAKLNAAAGREPHVRYHVERYREKWAIARQSVRTYWGWDEFITRGFELREAAGTAAAKKRENLDMPVTPQYLLQGAWYALEQCGLLLRDGNVLYRNSAYASAVVLTAFAREELGRSRILLDCCGERSVERLSRWRKSERPAKTT